MNWGNLLTEARKFLVALVAALAILAVAITVGSDGGTAITPSEWIQIVIGFLAALGVYAIPNISSKE